jgi:hypothetical protein
LPISAVDAINPAIEHTKRQLFQPFRFGQWWRISLVGLLAGELSSGGGCNVPSIPHFPKAGGTQGMPPGFPEINFAMLAGLIAVLVVAAFVLGLLLMYISSVMRFILFDSVLTKECRIRDGWGRRQGPGWRYFLWKLLYMLAMFGVLIVVVGIPAGLAFAMGLLNDPKQHLAPLILGGLAVFFVAFLFMISMAVVYVLTKDFVVPQMALENIGAIEGWRRLWAMIKSEKGGYAGYVGMKIVLSIAASIILGMIGLILALIVLIPLAGLVIAAVLAGKSAGMGFTVAAITLAVVGGAVLLALFLLLTSLISVPAIVFFPAYSIYFFAGRYPALGAALYPAPPASQSPAAAAPPPYEPPPLPPAPAPIG